MFRLILGSPVQEKCGQTCVNPLQSPQDGQRAGALCEKRLFNLQKSVFCFCFCFLIFLVAEKTKPGSLLRGMAGGQEAAVFN